MRAKTFDRYTEGARRAVFYALHQANHRKQGEITTTDLLLGVAMEGRKVQSTRSPLHGRWDELLKKLGLTTDQGGCPKNECLPLSQSSKRVLGYAVLEADRDRRYSIDEGHLLRGVLSEDRRLLRSLSDMGLTLEGLRMEALRNFDGVPDKRRPFFFIRQRYRRWMWILLGCAVMAVVFYLHWQDLN